MGFYNLHAIYANSGSNRELGSYQAEFGDAVEQHIVKLGGKINTWFCTKKNTDKTTVCPLRAGQYHKARLGG